LGVFAHPDDETSCAAGTFARYAREGVAVYVVTATRGEQATLGTNRLVDLFEHTPWAVEALHQAYPPVPVGVQSVGFWETTRTSDPAVLMPHTRQNNTEMAREERQSQ
jgi:GlcNAc-PI de-N-acetylase